MKMHRYSPLGRLRRERKEGSELLGLFGSFSKSQRCLWALMWTYLSSHCPLVSPLADYGCSTSGEALGDKFSDVR